MCAAGHCAGLRSQPPEVGGGPGTGPGQRTAGGTPPMITTTYLCLQLWWSGSPAATNVAAPGMGGVELGCGGYDSRRRCRPGPGRTAAEAAAGAAGRDRDRPIGGDRHLRAHPDASGPAHVHVVVSTRADPDLPLARWRVRGELVEIRAADLRFTSDEANAYLNVATGLDLAGRLHQPLGRERDRRRHPGSRALHSRRAARRNCGRVDRVHRSRACRVERVREFANTRPPHPRRTVDFQSRTRCVPPWGLTFRPCDQRTHLGTSASRLLVSDGGRSSHCMLRDGFRRRRASAFREV